MPPHMPRPPFQIASQPHQLCGTSFQLVMSCRAGPEDARRHAPQRDRVDQIGVAAVFAPKLARHEIDPVMPTT